MYKVDHFTQMGGHFRQESHKMVNIISEIEDICKQGSIMWLHYILYINPPFILFKFGPISVINIIYNEKLQINLDEISHLNLIQVFGEEAVLQQMLTACSCPHVFLETLVNEILAALTELVRWQRWGRVVTNLKTHNWRSHNNSDLTTVKVTCVSCSVPAE